MSATALHAVVSAPPVRGYRSALSALNGAQKSGAGFPAYTRWVNRRLARYPAALAFRLGWTPDGVTAASAIASAAGIAVLLVAPAGIGSALAIAVLLAAGYVLDSADGQLARLSGRGGPAGEWLDHVVDAVRTPVLHLAVLVAVTRALPGLVWPQVAALLFCVVAVGQFMSQILAEQLSSRAHRGSVGASARRSVLLLPTDTGVLCWLFLLWAVPVAFAVAYAVLLVANALHAAASMRRKHRDLVAMVSP